MGDNMNSNRTENEKITYAIDEAEFLTKTFEYKNRQTKQVYNFKVSQNSSKLFDSPLGQGILKLKRQRLGLGFTSTTWNLTYYEKNLKRYQEVTMIKKAFQIKDKYTLNFKRHDNATITLYWTLSDPQYQSILEYYISMFNKKTLKQFRSIDNTDLPIYFISLVTITMDDDNTNLSISSTPGATDQQF